MKTTEKKKAAPIAPTHLLADSTVLSLPITSPKVIKQLIETHSGTLHKFAKSLLNSEHIIRHGYEPSFSAEALVQEMTIVLLRRCRIPPGRTFTSHAYGVMREIRSGMVRKHRRRTNLMEKHYRLGGDLR